MAMAAVVEISVKTAIPKQARLMSVILKITCCANGFSIKI
jgi:hypothetical protein